MNQNPEEMQANAAGKLGELRREKEVSRGANPAPLDLGLACSVAVYLGRKHEPWDSNGSFTVYYKF